MRMSRSGWIQVELHHLNPADAYGILAGCNRPFALQGRIARQENSSLLDLNPSDFSEDNETFLGVQSDYCRVT